MARSLELTPRHQAAGLVLLPIVLKVILIAHNRSSVGISGAERSNCTATL
jgi:hypothetical protein